MMLAENVFDMSGGTIDNNLVTGFDNDTITVSGTAEIGGNISVSSGVDRVTISGGSVGGEVRMGAGDDIFTWETGGVVEGMIDLAGDTDTATLRNLTVANLGTTPLISGGAGVDGLTFDNASTNGVARFQNWESVDVENGSELTFDANLVLGDMVTGTGSLTVDATSVLFGGGGNWGISPFTAGQFVEVTNSGTIDLSNAGNSLADTFTIGGNYIGTDGTLRLQTELGDDASPSDKFVISGGSATGTTGIQIVNVGGAGAATTLDGIMVVETINNGTTAGGAFALDGAVAAGAYEYFLFRGGTSAGTEENWYLRSALIAPPPTPQDPDPSPPPSPAPPTPGAQAPDADVIPLYRVEAPIYSVVPPIAQQLALATLGTFHERQGEQALLQGTGVASGAWGRVLGQSFEQSWSGTLDPSFDGSLIGLQAGLDLFASESAAGHRNRAGLFVGHAHMDGDVTGFANGWLDLDVGKLDLDGTSLAGYWTHIGPGGWYVDGIAMGTWFYGDARSTRGVGSDIDGMGATLSMEGGYPIAFGPNWALEPQAQIVWQHLSLDDAEDAFSNVEFDADDALTGRIGSRLSGAFQLGGAILRPYLKGNVWHDFGGTDETIFAGTDVITTEREGTSLEVGGGLAVQISPSIGLFATADYTTNLGGEEREVWEGNAGLRAIW